MGEERPPLRLTVSTTGSAAEPLDSVASGAVASRSLIPIRTARSPPTGLAQSIWRESGCNCADYRLVAAAPLAGVVRWSAYASSSTSSPSHWARGLWEVDPERDPRLSDRSKSTPRAPSPYSLLAMISGSEVGARAAALSELGCILDAYLLVGRMRPLIFYLVRIVSSFEIIADVCCEYIRRAHLGSPLSEEWRAIPLPPSLPPITPVAAASSAHADPRRLAFSNRHGVRYR